MRKSENRRVRAVELTAVMPSEMQIFLRQTITKLVLPFCLMGLFVWVALRQTSGIEASEIGLALRQIPTGSVLLCLALSAFSLLAVSGYDAVAVRLLGIRVPPHRALMAGFSAVAFGQALGFGTVTGALVRWRMGRQFGLSLMGAAMISGVVTVAFMLTLLSGLSLWLVLKPTDAASLTALPEVTLRGLGYLGIGLAAALICGSVFHPELRIMGRHVTIPGLRAIRRIAALTLLDLVPAGLAFWVLLPSGAAPDPLSFLPIYALALGAALLSNAPAGIGALEATTLICLPDIPMAELLAALIVYRGIYYGLPLIPATWMLLGVELNGRTQERRRSSMPRTDIIPPAGVGALPLEVELILRRSRRAESALACLGDKSFLMTPGREAFLMIARHGNTLTALADPVGPEMHWPFLAKRFVEEADTGLLDPCAYKTGTRWAACLQAEGLKVRKLGEEAILDPTGFSTEGSARRQLRRKLRQAEKAGLRIEHHAAGRLPMQDLARIDAQWQGAHGTPMGFSQGIYAPQYLAHFECLTASIGGKPVAFVSLWRSGDGLEMSIDVMRHCADAPEGAMHSLIAEAIGRASADGVSRFSLCSVLLKGLEGEPGRLSAIAARLYASDRTGRGLRGLARFKDIFAPDWQPVHVASRGGLPMGAALAVRAQIMAPLPEGQRLK